MWIIFCFITKSVGLYATNSAETNKFILGDCKANILVVEEESTVEAIRPFWNDLPNLKKIIVWGEKKSDILYSNLVLRWEDVMSLGDDLDDDPLLERQKNMAINQCCVLIYTSGTTGNPKGNAIMLWQVVHVALINLWYPSYIPNRCYRVIAWRLYFRKT